MAQKFYVVGRRNGGKFSHPPDEYPLRLIRKLDADGNRPEFGWREILRKERRLKAYYFDSPEEAEQAAEDTLKRLQQTAVSRVVVIKYKVVPVDK